MKGLSSTALEKTNELWRSLAVTLGPSSVRPGPLKTRPISATASMLMPAFVEPTATENADEVSHSQAFGDGVDEDAVASVGAPFDQGREAADEVDADFFGCLVEGPGDVDA